MILGQRCRTHGPFDPRSCPVPVKRELIDAKNDWEDVDDVMLATMDWVQSYNKDRFHSYSGDMPPKKYQEYITGPGIW